MPVTTPAKGPRDPYANAPASGEFQRLRRTLGTLALVATWLCLALPWQGAAARGGSLVEFQGQEIRIQETAGSLRIMVQTTQALAGPLRLGVEVLGGEGAQQGQISPLQSEIELPAGQSYRALDFIIADDSRLTGDQRFEVRLFALSNPFNQGIVAPLPVQILLVDDEAFPAVRLADAQFFENSAESYVDVLLDRKAEVPAMLTLGLFADTAEGNVDFALDRTVLTIAPGQQGARLSVTLFDDARYEADERFYARVLASDSLGIADAEAEIIIRNDDPPPTLVLRPGLTSEDQVQGHLLVELDKAVDLDTQVAYTFLSNTAEAGVDFVARSGILRFPAGNQQQRLPYALIDDARDEPAEHFAVRFSAPQGIALPQTDLSITLADNDPPPRLLVSGGRVQEASTQSLNLALSAPSQRPLAFSVRLVSATGLVPDDAEPLEQRRVIPAGQTQIDPLIIVTKQDSIYEAGEFLLLEFFDAEHVIVPSTPVRLDLVDTKTLPRVSLQGVKAREGEADNALRFTLSHPSTLPARFHLHTLGGSARAGDDFAPIAGTFTFAPGQTELTIPLTLIDDALNEADETWQVLLSAVGGLILSENSFPLTIEDDDPLPTLTLSAAPSIDEGDPQGLTVTMTLSAPSQRPISFAASLSAAQGTADTVDTADTASQDFESDTYSIRIAPGSRQASLVLKPRDDILFEDDERFTLTLQDPENLILAQTRLEFSLLNDDDPPIAELRVPKLREGADSQAAVLLSKPAGKDTHIRLALRDGTARRGRDYEPQALDLTIAEGQSRITLPITLIDNLIHERPETFEITLLEAQGAEIGVNVVTAEIHDDDPPPVLSLTQASAYEDPGEAPVTFALSTVSDAPVVLDLAVVQGSAIPGQDFLTRQGQVTFAPRQTTQVFDLQVIDDPIYEGPQELRLLLVGLSGATLADQTPEIPGAEQVFWTITLVDNDPLPKLSVQEGQVQESALPGTNQLTFTLDRLAELPLSFAYDLADPEIAGADLRLDPGRVTFAPRQRQQTLALTPVQDSLDEGQEAVQLRLTDPKGLRLSTEALRITILDDDPTPELSLVPVPDGTDTDTDAERPQEQQEAAREAEARLLAFEARLAAPSGRPIQIEVATAVDQGAQFPATPGLDFQPLTQSLLFLPGETVKRIQVQSLDDRLDEPEETLALEITSADFARLGSARAIGKITDDDPAPTISAADITLSETQQDSGALYLTLSEESGKTVLVRYTLEPVTADLGIDIEPLAGTAIFLAGDTQVSLPLKPIDDAIDEADETLRLQLFNPVEGQLTQRTATVTLSDDEAGPELWVDAKHLGEGVPRTESKVSLRLATSAAQPLTLAWETRSQSAQAGLDFLAESGSLTFAPGQREAEIALNLLNDVIDEGEETFELRLSSSQIRIETPRIPLTILDDDRAPDLRLEETRFSESSGRASLNLRLSAAAERDLPGRLTVTPTSAVQGEDFDVPSLEFVVPAGQTSLAIPLVLIEDTNDEIDERFEVSARLNVTDRGQDATATVYIDDDDAAPRLTLRDLMVDEGARQARVPVLLSEPSGKTLSLTYAPIPGSARPGEDYVDGSRTLAVPAGTTAFDLPIPLIDDAHDEIDESFGVEILKVTQAEISRAEARITLRDDDAAVFARILPVTGEEGTQLSVPIILDQPSGQPIELVLETVSGVGVANQDYIAKQGKVFIEPETQQGRFVIDLIDDGFAEETETFGLRFVSGRNVQFDQAPVLMEIQDNDAPASLSLRTENMVEGETGRLIFTLTAESSAVEVVEFQVANGTAEQNKDFALESQALIFLPRETEKVVPIPLRADGLDEVDETFEVSILAATLPRDQEQITVTIRDRDPRPALRLTLPPINEAQGELPIDLALSSASELDITATLRLALPAPTFSPGLPPQELDVLIPAGQDSLRLTLPIQDDVFDEEDETLTLEVVDLVNAEAPQTRFATVISDDDPPSQIALVSTSLKEAQTGTQLLEFALDRPSGKPISFNYVFAEASARRNSDWQGFPGGQEIPVGSTQASLEVTVLDDELYEGDETFLVRLSNIVNAQAVERETTLTIEENEPPPTLIVHDFEVEEGKAVRLPLEIGTAAAMPLTVRLMTLDQSGEIGADLDPLVSEVTFEPGLLMLTLPLKPIDDPFDEPEETIALYFAAEAVQVPEAGITLKILDNDPPPRVLASDIQTQEGLPAELRLTLSLASNKPIEFDLVPQSGTATLGEDFVFDAQKLVFAPGETEKLIPLISLSDALDEHEETWTIDLRQPQNVTLPSPSLAVTIADDNPLPTLEFTDKIVLESAPPTERSITVTLSEASGRKIQATLDAVGASASVNEDFAPLLTQLVFEPGETQKTFVLPIINDDLFEKPETLILTLGGVDYARVLTPDALVSILDDDPAPRLTYEDLTFEEGDETVAIQIPFTLSEPAGRPLTFDLTLIENLGTENLGTENLGTENLGGEPDLRFDHSSLRFNSGETRVTLQGFLIGDRRDEEDQEIRIVAESRDGLSVPERPLTLRIQDQDPAPRLSLQVAPLQEGQTQAGSVKISLSMASEKQVNASIVSQDGTATQGQDYHPIAQAFEFAPGQTELTLPIELIDDRLFEPTETFTLSLDDLVNAAAPQTQTIVEIRNDDPQPQVLVEVPAIVEGTQAQARISLDRPSSQQVGLSYTLTDGTARLGPDFQAQSGTLLFEPGEVSKPLMLSALADEIDEPDEVMNLLFLGVDQVSAPAQATAITIVDNNERPSFTVSADPSLENAPSGQMVFALTLSHASALPLTLNYSTSSQTATQGQDFLPANADLRLEPGQRQAEIRIDLIDDALFEGEETFALHLAYVDDPASRVTVSATLRDDETPPNLGLEERDKDAPQPTDNRPEISANP